MSVLLSIQPRPSIVTIIVFSIRAMTMPEPYDVIVECWDKGVAHNLRQQGLNQEQIGFVLGIIAEHRQTADRCGYKRGYDRGYEDGFRGPIYHSENFD